MKILEKIILVLKDGFVCDACLGRCYASLLSGYSNEERGKIIRRFIAFLIDSGEKLDVDLSNFYGIKFRNVKFKPEKPEECKICKNFFLKKMDELAKNVIKKVKGIEFDTFQIGSIISDELLKNEEKILETIGIEFSESIKSEINRELGKKIEKLTEKKFAPKNPDLTIIVDLNTNSVKTQIRSLYLFGKYKKLVRGIPQTKWTCSRCGGKGCIYCNGEGKLYKTSIQEEIERPLLKATRTKKSSMHASGREDVDARCLDYRPFVIELIKPLKRKIDLKKITKEINKSKKVKISGLKEVIDAKQLIRKLKTEKWDKTYLAEVEFVKPIDRKKLKILKGLTKEPILQKTPLRVVHRRADKFRKRRVKSISYKLVGKKRVKIKIRAESGLYIKELINGDSSRTKPSVAEMLDNTPKRINLDVLKVHSKIRV